MPMTAKLAKDGPDRTGRAVFAGRFLTIAAGFAAVGWLAWILLEAGRPPVQSAAFRSVESRPDLKTATPRPDETGAADQRSGPPGAPASKPSADITTRPPAPPPLVEGRVPGSAPIVGNLILRDSPSKAEPPPMDSAAGRRASDIAAATSDQVLETLKQDGSPGPTSTGASSSKKASAPVPGASPAEAGASERAESGPAPEADAGTPATTAAVTPPLQPTAAAGASERARRSDQAAMTRKRAESDAPKTPTRERPRAREKAEAERRPPVNAQRTRTAATQERASAPPAPPLSGQPAADVDRPRLLGIPLPTGSEIRQCLLEFRC